MENNHELFQKDFENGFCSFCQKPLKNFNRERPCFHWFLKPTSIKKSDIEGVLKKIGFFKVNIYLRWVANSEQPLVNINDFESDDKSKIIEESIIWKRLKWSFSCSKTDFQGHVGKQAASHPHFHFAMSQDGRPFISLNNFHIPFTENDLKIFEIDQQNSNKLGHFGKGSAGINSFFEGLKDGENLKRFLSSSNPPKDPQKAQVRMSTLIMPEEGKTISGEDIRKIYKKAEEENTSVAYQISKADALANAEKTTYITPGDAVPEIHKRPRRKKKK